MVIKASIGKILYGAIFVLVLPVLLILWAYYTAGYIHLPVPSHQLINYAGLATGLFFVLVGMHNLWFYGEGLPMNAYPPKNFVTDGVFAIVRHPIYFGMVIGSFSTAAILHSASGFWLVCPLFTLMIISYVIGFENERIEQVFGQQRHQPFLSLPAATTEPADIRDKTSAFLLAFLHWLLVYEAFIFLGVPKDAIYSNLPIDATIPLVEVSALFYLATYPVAAFIPFLINAKKLLRDFIIDAWLATALAGFIYFALPLVVQQTPFTAQTLLGELLLLDRTYDGMSAACPAFHVIWAFLAAHYYSMVVQKLKFCWYALAVLMSISCLTTGNHTVIDVGGGFVVFLMLRHKFRLWHYSRALAETIANSWHEWRLGSIRIINHGFYGGAAGFVGTLFIGSLLGAAYASVGFLLGLCAIVGAALWGQYIEGSPKLQRPYGYYGSVLGVLFGSLLLFIVFRLDFYLLLAAFAIAAPWIQILGRLRCLVQGCCHGRPSIEPLGIRFIHPYSRVNKISGLHGAALHPTQLYSIASNFISGIILIRLYTLQTPMTFIIGLYLVLNGLGRFVEEYFRGEAQTPYWAGMRIYQWIALINVIVGAILTCIPSGQMPGMQWNIPSLFWAIAMGLLATVAYGVDFPDSQRRFARLTSE